MFQFLATTQAGCRRSFPRHLPHRITTLAISSCIALIAQLIDTPTLNAQRSDRPNLVSILADDLGFSHHSYGSGWANLGNTPLNMYKHFCHEGGIASPLIVHWSKHKSHGGGWVHDPTHLPERSLAVEHLGDCNWGLVDGKTQTIHPWSSWKQKFTGEPGLWHDDIFRRDGSPYRKAETKLISQLSKQPPTRQSQAPKIPSPASRAEIEAGLKAHDRALFVKRGWIRDPYIAIGPEGNYYLTGTTPLPDDPRQTTDPYNTGLGPLSIVGWKMQVWRSKDLIEWESLGTPFSLKDGIWFREKPDAFKSVPESQWRLWAPELHWVGDRWALVHTSPSPVAGANLSLTKGAEVAGPWENPMGATIQRRHDPSLFHDDDGTWWMVWGATSIAPLKPDFSGFAAQPANIGPSGEAKAMGHEGCLLHKIGDKYVLFGTGWSTGQMRRGSYNLYYATADNLTGPYSERKFVGRFLGHGTPFKDKQGRWWCTGFFNANVPPLSRDGIETKDIGDNAKTINEQGVTLVPLEVTVLADGDIQIRAVAPGYATPGPDESQQFER